MNQYLFDIVGPGGAMLVAVDARTRDEADAKIAEQVTDAERAAAGFKIVYVRMHVCAS